MSGYHSVLLVGGYAGLKSHSMVLFADSLADALRARGIAVRQLDPPVVLGRVGGRRLRKWLAHVDRLVIFPLLLAAVARRYPLIHLCDHSFAFYSALLPGKRVVITCHDLIGLRRADGGYADESASATGRLLQAAVRARLRSAPQLICVSEATRADLLASLDIPDARVRVVHNGLNRPYAPMNAAESDYALEHAALENAVPEQGSAAQAPGGLRAIAQAPYLLHVGSGAWRKNRAGVVEIFADLRARAPALAESLLMVGEPPDADLCARIDRLGLAPRVHFLTGVGHTALRALYSRAQWLLFPSFYEGFGWPVIEAQACGCPVLTSERPPLPEVAGEAAVFVNPEDAAGAAARLLAAWPRRERLIAAGLENAKRFSMAKMAEGYAAAYAQAMAGAVTSTPSALPSHPDHALKGLAMSPTSRTSDNALAAVQPLLVCPGVQKAASTWIHRQLEAHPEVSCTTRKEIDFWGARYANGHAWYAAQFPAPGERKLYADITPAYFLDRSLPERLARDCPDTRVLVLLRDPYERTFSSYQHSLRSGDVRSDFATALQQVPELLDYSRYASGLASYFQHFPRERVKIMFTEALEAEPRAALRELYAFAGVDPDFVPPDMDKRVNVGQAYSRGRHVLETVERFCKDRGLERKHLKRLGVDGLLDDVHGWFARRHRRPELPTEARELLALVLEPEIDALEQLLGMDFSAWRWSNGARVSAVGGARAAQPSSSRSALGVHAG